MAAQKNTIVDLLRNKNLRSEESLVPEFPTDDSPPPSDVSSLSPVHSLPSSPEYATQIKEESDDEPMPISRGMMDQSRVALFVFMFAIVSFNPFGLVLNKFGTGDRDYSTSYEGRNILSCKLNLFNIYRFCHIFHWIYSN